MSPSLDPKTERDASGTAAERHEYPLPHRPGIVTVYECMTDALLAVDADWRLSYVNPQAEALLNRRSGDLLGGSLWEELPELAGSAFEREVFRAFRQQTPVMLEEHCAPLGIWLEIRAFPAELGLCIYLRDVTARRRADRERSQLVGQLEAIFQSIADGILISDMNGYIHKMNPAACEILGWEPCDDFRLHQSDFQRTMTVRYPDGRLVPQSEWPLARVLRGDVFHNYEVRVQREGRDGETWVNYSGTSVHDAAGAAALVVLGMRNVTPLREAQFAQRRFVREILFGITEGCLRLCDSEEELPPSLPPAAEPIKLTQPTLHLLRDAAVSAAAALDFPEPRRQDFGTAVGEAAVNAVVHGHGGVGQVHADPERGIVQVQIHDAGAGITDDVIHQATLVRGYSSAGTLGHGFWLMLHTADRIWLYTSPKGTTIIIEQERTPPEPSWLRDR